MKLMITGTSLHLFQGRAAAPRRSSALRSALLLQVLLAAFFLRPAAAAEVQQTLQLNYGWNAVWLEVEPRYAVGDTVRNDAGDPNDDEVLAAGDPRVGGRTLAQDVFSSDTFEIDKVANLVRLVGGDLFALPEGTSNDRDDWDVWSNPAPSGETADIAVEGNHAYLVHVVIPTEKNAGDPAGDLNLQGKVEFYQPTWNKGRLNLVGFSVEGAPTFDALFAGSGIEVDKLADPPTVQRLDSADGTWKAVAGTEPVESGKTYWINVPYLLPGRGWAGPVETDFPGAISGSLNFGSGPGSLEVVDPADPTETLLMSSAELTFSSLEEHEHEDGHQHRVTVSRLFPEAADNELQFFALEPVPLALQWQIQPVDFSSGWPAAELSPRARRSVTVGVRRNWTTGTNLREHLYKVAVFLEGGGSVYRYLPVTAINPNLPADSSDTPPASEFTGFWAGQVTLDAVTSLGTAGAPLQPASSQLPLRIFLHVDDAGQASLVSRAILMQTKTASPEVPPEPVLVLDESRIPFFEGIQERVDGTRVALRFETANFDMPRDLRAAKLSTELRAKVAEAKLPDETPVTDEDVFAYFSLATRDERPSNLPETYYLSWPLSGQLGVGHTVETTASEPLTLDPFHRSNPFRHAFHRRHGKGYRVTRSFSIRFDAAPGPTILTGTYQETTSGLARQDIVSEGAIALRRLSNAEIAE